jgi:glycosyltransferase involved in cell wall biosynthesis
MPKETDPEALKVLILADLCNPDWPSLPVVGYKYAKAIANYADVTVVTQIRNKPNLDRDGLGKANIVYLDTEKIAAPIHKFAQFLRGGSDKGWTLQMAMDYPSYLAFEWFALREFRSALMNGTFDIVHRITPMSPTLPSYMAGQSPTPFVIGPLNGNLPWPKQFKAELTREREWLSAVRNAYKFLPFHGSTYRQSAAILAAFDHTIQDFPTALHPKIVNVPEVGIDPDIFALPQRSPKEKMTILYVGRLVPYKLPEVVVRAFAKSSLLQEHRLVVVGDGPERPRLEQLVKEHQLEDCVELAGRKPQAEVGQMMREADIFAFPSIRELGAGVVVEAMACGMACVVVDYGGPATLIDSDRGIKVPLENLDNLVGRYQTELEKLVSDRTLTEKLGQAAHKHAMNYYTWDAKARKTIDIYHWILGQEKSKPSFWN